MDEVSSHFNSLSSSVLNSHDVPKNIKYDPNINTEKKLIAMVLTTALLQMISSELVDCNNEHANK